MKYPSPSQGQIGVSPVRVTLIQPAMSPSSPVSAVLHQVGSSCFLEKGPKFAVQLLEVMWWVCGGTQGCC